MKRKVLVAGCGGIGERHVRVLSDMHNLEVSVCDSNETTLEAIKRSYHVSKTFSLWQDIDLEKFEIVVICTPANLHLPFMIDALEAGCHVLCEKPLSLSFDGIEHAIQLAEEKNRVVGIAYICRSMPSLRLLRHRIVTGEIGQVKSASFLLGSDFSFFRPDYKEIYYSDPTKGGGALHDAVSHTINYVEWCMGSIDSIYCKARHLVLPEVAVEDTVSCIFGFTDSEAIGTLSLNQFQTKNEMIMEFAGIAGTLKFDGENHSIGICKEPNGVFSWSESMLASRDEYHKLQFENFINTVDGTEQIVCSIQEAQMTMNTILAAHESVRQGRPISIFNYAQLNKVF